jgi:hypothetical protein
VSSDEGGAQGPHSAGNLEARYQTSVPLGTPKPAMANVVASEIDSVEAALSDALTRASAAGEWSAVAALAKELEARRLARAATNVIAIDRSTRGGRS